MRLLLDRLDSFFNSAAKLCGGLACVAMLILLCNVFYDVVMRYVFNDVSIGMQELEWHLFACVFLLGTPYALQRDGHVRVDILYDRWSDATKALINIFGVLLFVLPFVVLVAIYGVDFAHQAFEIGEGSGDPGGLPHRWIIKSLIPVSFILMAIASLAMVTNAVKVLLGERSYAIEQKEHLS